jgi:hypothetical protein
MRGLNQFLITPEAIARGPTVDTFVEYDGVPGGDWTIVAYDSSVATTFTFGTHPGYQSRDDTVIGSDPPVSVQFSYDSTDSGNGDGVVSFVLSGGVGPILIVFNGQVVTGTTITNLRRGAYQLQTFDQGTRSNCSGTFPFEVVQTSAPILIAWNPFHL